MMIGGNCLSLMCIVKLTFSCFKKETVLHICHCVLITVVADEEFYGHVCRFHAAVKSLNRQLVTVFNFLVTVAGAFAFGYKAAELSIGKKMFPVVSDPAMSHHVLPVFLLFQKSAASKV